MKALLIGLVQKAGALMKRKFNKPFAVYYKGGPYDKVTSVDKEVEALVLQEIKTSFPEHSVLSEECGYCERSSDYTWILDPIDGTNNFAQGIPLCAVSLALKKGKEMIMGAVYNPLAEEFFWAEKGAGAYLNGQRLRTDNQKSLSDSVLCTGFLMKDKHCLRPALAVFERLLIQGVSVRRLGSAALNMCWVAAGRFGAFYQFSALPVWDMAAGYVIAQEAGVKITDLYGASFSLDRQPNGFIMAHSGVHGNLQEVIAACIS